MVLTWQYRNKLIENGREIYAVSLHIFKTTFKAFYMFPSTVYLILWLMDGHFNTQNF